MWARSSSLAKSEEVFSHPRHPYTEALLSSVPLPDPTRKSERMILEGEVANPAHPPSGCYFHPRCPMRPKNAKKKRQYGVKFRRSILSLAIMRTNFN